jgi:hypothetical protein
MSAYNVCKSRRYQRMNEIYLFLNLGFIIMGYRGMKAVTGLFLGGLMAFIYAFITDPDAMLGLLMFTGGAMWLVIILVGFLLGVTFTMIGIALRIIFNRTVES